jgi:hypothetical protein
MLRNNYLCIIMSLFSLKIGDIPFKIHPIPIQFTDHGSVARFLSSGSTLLQTKLKKVESWE